MTHQQKYDAKFRKGGAMRVDPRCTSMTLEQVAEILGLSYKTVWRDEQNALRKLRSNLLKLCR